MLLYLRGNILKYLGIKCYSESSQFLNGSVKKKKKRVCMRACACMYVWHTEREKNLLVTGGEEPLKRDQQESNQKQTLNLYFALKEG